MLRGIFVRELDRGLQIVGHEHRGVVRQRGLDDLLSVRGFVYPIDLPTHAPRDLLAGRNQHGRGVRIVFHLR